VLYRRHINPWTKPMRHIRYIEPARPSTGTRIRRTLLQLLAGVVLGAIAIAAWRGLAL